MFNKFIQKILNIIKVLFNSDEILKYMKIMNNVNFRFNSIKHSILYDIDSPESKIALKEKCEKLSEYISTNRNEINSGIETTSFTQDIKEYKLTQLELIENLIAFNLSKIRIFLNEQELVKLRQTQQTHEIFTEYVNVIKTALNTITMNESLTKEQQTMIKELLLTTIRQNSYFVEFISDKLYNH